MAVEPRKIKQPTKTGLPSPAADSESPDAISAGAGKKSLPIIPILAALVGLVVLGLLGKVVLAK